MEIMEIDCGSRIPHYDGNSDFYWRCLLTGDRVDHKKCAECSIQRDEYVTDNLDTIKAKNGDAVNAPAHYVGKIECIDYLRDKLTPAEFTGFCMGNVLKYCSRWRKKDGLQDLKKAAVYLGWAIENEEKHA